MAVGNSIQDHALAAVGLCSLQNLRSLTICESHRDTAFDDNFYTGMSAAASLSKIQELKHRAYNRETIELGPTASYHYAIGLCSMPNLRSVELKGVKPSDEFFSAMASEASKSKIQELKHEASYEDRMELGPTASYHYAIGLCSMPNLRSLELVGVKPDNEFFSTMASEASKSKIQELKHRAYNRETIELGPTASYQYAIGLCSMPNLRALALINVTPSDEFFSAMASEGSKSKIQELKHESYKPIGPTASYHYAIGLCSMPNLRSLELIRVKASDEFFSVMASEGSKSKIQTLVMHGMSRITRHILHTILSLPCLLSLRLTGIGNVDMDDGETLDTSRTTSVDELSLDGRHVTSLWELGLHTSCPRVQKLLLYWAGYVRNISSDIVVKACSPFHHLTHLHIKGYMMPDSSSFCSAVITSCPRLTKLSLAFIELFNEGATNMTKIIQSMKNHPNLTNIELIVCDTNKDLDPFITEVNSEGKLTVTVKHDMAHLENLREMWCDFDT